MPVEFQFQTGAIKSPAVLGAFDDVFAFQFQTGAIKSQVLSSLVINLTGFNSKLVRLKAGRGDGVDSGI